jgi:hypothetical protein
MEQRRLLAAYGNDLTYGYNSDGIMAEKTVSGVLHRYYLEGDRIHKETYGNNVFWYYYEAGGLLFLSLELTDC